MQFVSVCDMHMERDFYQKKTTAHFPGMHHPPPAAHHREWNNERVREMNESRPHRKSFDNLNFTFVPQNRIDCIAKQTAFPCIWLDLLAKISNWMHRPDFVMVIFGGVHFYLPFISCSLFAFPLSFSFRLSLSISINLCVLQASIPNNII